MTGLAIETATEHVEVLVLRRRRRRRSRSRPRTSGTATRAGSRRWSSGRSARAGRRRRRARLGRGRSRPRLVHRRARRARDRRGAGARVAAPSCCGASSLAALALGAGARRALVVPLVPAGRRDVYAGFFRADARGRRAPAGGAARRARSRARSSGAREALALLGGVGGALRRPGRGARARRARGARSREHRAALARRRALGARPRRGAARSARGPRRPGLAAPRRARAREPLYVRPAQAEERVRRRVLAARSAATFARSVPADMPDDRARSSGRCSAIPGPSRSSWASSRSPLAHARVAERGRRAGGLQPGVARRRRAGISATSRWRPRCRRRGVAAALLEDLLERAQRAGVDAPHARGAGRRTSPRRGSIVRTDSGWPACAARYYRDTGEDALVMEWRAPASEAPRERFRPGARTDPHVLAQARTHRHQARRASPSASEVPEGLWTKCEGCGEALFQTVLEENLWTCPQLRLPLPRSGRTYLGYLVDEGSFEERDADLEAGDPLEFRDAKMRYPDRLAAAQQETGMKDAALSGVATVGGKPVSLTLMDFFFMGGSMGSVVGEKVARSIEAAIAERRARDRGVGHRRRPHAGGHPLAHADGQDLGAAGAAAATSGCRSSRSSPIPRPPACWPRTRRSAT